MKGLNPRILRPLLARRRATFPPRSYVAAAAIREREFSEVSLSYREHHPTLESDVIVEVEDVALCVPSNFALKVKIPWKIIQMTRKLTVGGIMLDVGANIGQTSVPRVLLGDFVAIYAAEPDLTTTHACDRQSRPMAPAGWCCPIVSRLACCASTID